ncbi:MAG: alpha/beta fold hydrolase [Culicoidibacterales bacterium]
MEIAVNGITLFYEKTGMGDPLLLLHGNGEDHRIFSPLIKKLEQHFSVYAIDSRNHGKSTKTTDYGYKTMAQDIEAFIHELDLGRVRILGFSDGAITGLTMALKNQELISKMALLGVNLKPSDFRDQTHAFLKRTYDQTKNPLVKLMLEEPQIEMDDLKEVNIETLVIAAQSDIFKPEVFVNIVEALPKGELLIMEGHQHNSYISGVDILAPNLLSFFTD